MKIPFFDLSLQYKSIENKIKKAVNEVLESQRFILGPKVCELEEKMVSLYDFKYAIGVSSGTDALLVSLIALDIKSGDLVITTPYSFFATAGVIARLGARPVFVDINPNTYNIDTAKLEELLNKGQRYKAIIPVNLYGQCADMDKIMELAQNYDIRVIEDAAQTIGAKYNNRFAGNLGDIGCFSFYPTKNLGGYGDGGMVTTSDIKLAEKIRSLRVHGAVSRYEHSTIGGNFRLDELQAAILLVKLQFLNNWTKKRQNNASIYNNLLEKSKLKIPYVLPQNIHVYNQYVIRVDRRDELKEYLAKQGIGTEIYYPIPFHLQECFKYLGYKKGQFLQSERASNETIALPIYPELTKDKQEYVVDKIKQFYS